MMKPVEHGPIELKRDDCISLEQVAAEALRRMPDQFTKYRNKLLRDRTAVPDSIRFYRLDDVITASREDDWLPVAGEIFSGLDITALVIARTTLPFPDLLVERSAPDAVKLVPRDSETRVFLHDIPFLRQSEWRSLSRPALAQEIIRCLTERKAVIIQGLGVVATGAVTVEQAFIGFSTVFHTTFVKYLLDLLTEGFRLPGERESVERFRKEWLAVPDLSDLSFASGPFQGPDAIVSEICRVGRATVDKGFVDSFFGNISYFDGNTIYISQTTSSLDELEGHIDPVPLDYSSTAGLSASSELPSHRAVYLATGYRTVLHGHPRFSIILSMLCDEKDCTITDCNRLCDRARAVCGVPIVAGETGAGGMARSIPVAIRESGVCIVYGHGIFAAGERDFREAFGRMAEVESRCRDEYFRLLDERTDPSLPGDRISSQRAGSP
jgi:ribulose-5-phosphate 4-epimerase/fuculose-1-phosphate aldolase